MTVENTEIIAPVAEKYSEDRPWGAFLVLADAAKGAQPIAVKILTVAPGQRLSLQTHTLRSEEWTPIDAGLQAQIGDTVYDLEPHVTYRVETGQVHRILNPGNAVGRIVEVMFGAYDEDDIVRLEDDYKRD
jgi:mannose-6-phosphate isomerase-like protein (cupin superfamily)